MRLSVRDAASLLHVSSKTIYRWVSDGKIPGYRVNKSFRFDHAELLEWATANRMEVATALLHEPQDLEPVPSFDKALENGGVHYRVAGEDRDAVLRGVVQAIRIPEEEDRELVYEALRAREDLASTAIGDGLALPHLRNPLRLRLNRPSVSLCLLDHPTDWHALDGLPVTALFVILAPTVRIVLQLHSRCLFALRDPTFRAAVLSHGSRDTLLAEARRVAASFPPSPLSPPPGSLPAR